LRYAAFVYSAASESKPIVSQAPQGITVAANAGGVHVRVAGRGTFQNGQPLRRYAQERIDHGCGQFVIDLGECLGMDSTFLGVLAGIGLRLNQSGKPGCVQIINAGSRNTELLQTLGLDRLFSINTGPGDHVVAHSLGNASFQKLPDTDVGVPARPLSKHDTADLMLEAHDNLIRADQRNLTKFKDLTQFLRENVAKRATAEQSKPPTP
jgi:anti-anti-sigma regulatory factor